MIEYHIYFNGNEIESKYAKVLADTIYKKLQLRKGDIFESRSFNAKHDEDTEFRRESEIYQDKPLTIKDIKIELLDSWNTTIRSIVHIYLVDQSVSNFKAVEGYIPLTPLQQKRIAWEANYSERVSWEEFKDEWTKCSECGCYTQGSCICYAR